MTGRVLVATVGLPGSGKTHWARAQIAEMGPRLAARVNRDDLRAMLHDRAYLDGTEQQIVAAQRAVIIGVWSTGTPIVICDDTNLNPATLGELRALAVGHSADLHIKSFLDVPLATCLHRNSLRRGRARLPEGRIVAMHGQLEALNSVLAQEKAAGT